MSDRSPFQRKTQTSLATVDAPNGAREGLAERVEALRQPASYPGEVGEVEAIETHMSWVFLTERHAHKLKKPIRTALFDHTTVERRRRACENELELNRRLAESVYLAVVPLVASGAKLRVEGEGEAIDWMVKMRRLPREEMLEARIERGAVAPGDVQRVVEKLSGFYETTEPAPMEASEYRERLASDIESKRASLEQPRYGLRRDDLEAVVASLQRWLSEHRELIERRAEMVVDAHGDLRPEHVFLAPETVVIDCLEFERSLRLLDPVSELSFLSLECRRLGGAWIGERLFAGYAERSGDEPAPPLIRFYHAYHALVRAAVAIWHLDDEELDDTEKWRGRATEYLRTARELS